MMAINMKSNAKEDEELRFYASCNLHICLAMLPYDRWQWHTHTHTCEGIRTYVCVHCSSRQMTVEWQRTNKTHVKNRTCNEQNKPQRDRERESERGGIDAGVLHGFLFLLSLSLFLLWLENFPSLPKNKSCPYLGKFAANLPPPLQRAAQENEREKQREGDRERARARVYCKSALA